jgi:hypothetical protein
VGITALSSDLRALVGRLRRRHPTEALRRHGEGGIELARHLLERDQRAQLDDGVVEVPLQSYHELVARPHVRERHRLRVLERHPLALVAQRAAVPVLERPQLDLGYAEFQERRGIDVDAEAAVVELRDPHVRSARSAGASGELLRSIAP